MQTDKKIMLILDYEKQCFGHAEASVKSAIHNAIKFQMMNKILTDAKYETRNMNMKIMNEEREKARRKNRFPRSNYLFNYSHKNVFLSVATLVCDSIIQPRRSYIANI